MAEAVPTGRNELPKTESRLLYLTGSSTVHEHLTITGQNAGLGAPLHRSGYGPPYMPTRRSSFLIWTLGYDILNP